MADSKPTQNPSKTAQVVVLRWGHRPQRDVRLTTHVALTARALCASGFVLADVEDASIAETVRKISERWGGTFHFEMGASWKKVVHDWKAKGGIIVHLTAYGENIQTSDVLSRIKGSDKDVLVHRRQPEGSRRLLLQRRIRLQRLRREPAPFRMRRTRRLLGPLF